MRPSCLFAAPSIAEESREVLAAFAELQSALSEDDSEAAFHALVHELTDLLYVAYGALVAFAVEPDDVFAEVTRQTCRKYPALGVRTENN